MFVKMIVDLSQLVFHPMHAAAGFGIPGANELKVEKFSVNLLSPTELDLMHFNCPKAFDKVPHNIIVC